MVFAKLLLEILVIAAFTKDFGRSNVSRISALIQELLFSFGNFDSCIDGVCIYIAAGSSIDRYTTVGITAIVASLVGYTQTLST
jgi:hypothetical protein